MILFIMRHGQAVDFRHPDHSRELTQFGTQQCVEVGEWIRDTLNTSQKAKTKFTSDKALIDLALVSPYLRTQQSFRAIAKSVDFKQQTTIDVITPMGSAAQASDLVHGYATDSIEPQTMLIVTHMPLVSLLSDKICPNFHAKIFDTADTLMVDYNTQTALGDEITFFQGKQ